MLRCLRGVFERLIQTLCSWTLFIFLFLFQIPSCILNSIGTISQNLMFVFMYHCHKIPDVIGRTFVVLPASQMYPSLLDMRSSRLVQIFRGIYYLSLIYEILSPSSRGHKTDVVRSEGCKESGDIFFKPDNESACSSCDMMKKTCSSETLIPTYHTTRCHARENHKRILKTHKCLMSAMYILKEILVNAYLMTLF